MRKSIKSILKVIIFIIAAMIIYRIYIIPKVIYPTKYIEYVDKYAAEYNLKKAIVFAVIKAESGFNENNRSKTGARGLMQIMPETGKWAAEIIEIENYSDDMLYDPDTNIHIGCWYLRYLLDMYEENLSTALAAYNAGCGTVNKWLEDKKYSSDGHTLDNVPYAETDGYVFKTLEYSDAYNRYHKEL